MGARCRASERWRASSEGIGPPAGGRARDDLGCSGVPRGRREGRARTPRRCAAPSSPSPPGQGDDAVRRQRHAGRTATTASRRSSTSALSWSTSSSHEAHRAAHDRRPGLATAPSARGHRGRRGDPWPACSTRSRSAMRPAGPAAGLSKCTACCSTSTVRPFACSIVDPGLPLSCSDVHDIPLEAFGPAGRRLRAADDVATKHRELVDARKQQVQGALDVVDDQCRPRCAPATRERDRAAATLFGDSGRWRSPTRSRRRGRVPGRRVAR